MPTVARDRRSFLTLCSSLGLGGTLFPGLLWARVQQTPPATPVTPELIDELAKLEGLDFPADARQRLVNALNGQVRDLAAMHRMELLNSDPPAQLFNPVLPGMSFDTEKRPTRLSALAAPGTPKDIEAVAFYNCRQLGELLRTKKISCRALTTMYIERLRRYDPLLHFVITVTEERALAQAQQADQEIVAGKYRGPLHGIPWGAKDLLAVKGYKTTWGAAPYEDQSFDYDATVVQRLDAAGAVLIAKLTLGALAQGDIWYGERTRNPWNPAQGSSGSSAGPASATAAGCVGFSVGSETNGSISSPSTVCGVTGLRPTFGRVPRTGAMTLSWTQDKLGPLCRTVEDCMLVLQAVSGPETQRGGDRSVHDLPMNWNAQAPLHGLRVGYLKEAFDRESDPSDQPGDSGRGGRGGGGAGAAGGAASAGRAGAAPLDRKARRLEQAKFDNGVLDAIRSLGIAMTPVTLPEALPFSPPSQDCEAAAAFDELTRSGRDQLMEGTQFPSTWPNTFRVAHFYPAVDYINADRLRLKLMEKMQDLFAHLDVLVLPTGGPQGTISNITGHPALIQPNGFRAADGTPTSITFLGPIFGEEKMCQLGRAVQEKLGYHLQHPELKLTS